MGGKKEMAFPKFNGSCSYLSAFREATPLELITNIPSFAFPHSINVHLNLLKAHSSPGRIKMAFCFQKSVCKKRKSALETWGKKLYFFFN